MKMDLNKLASLYQRRIKRFIEQDRGILAMEYALIIATLGVLFIAAFREGGSFHDMFLEIWRIISSKVMAALNAIV